MKTSGENKRIRNEGEEIETRDVGGRPPGEPFMSPVTRTLYDDINKALATTKFIKSTAPEGTMTRRKHGTICLSVAPTVS